MGNDIDYRVNRWEACKAYHIGCMRINEIDPNTPLLQYASKKLSLDVEQRLWLAFLYSTCDCSPNAFYMLSKLPRLEYVNEPMIRGFWKKYKETLHFGEDRRYVYNGKDNFVDMVLAYKKLMKGGQLKNLMRFKKGSKMKTYDEIYAYYVKRLPYMSQFSMFLWLEMARNLTNIPILPSGIDLRISRTVRNGIACALGLDEYCEINGENKGLASKNIAFLQQKLRQLYNELLDEYPDVKTDYWNLETSLCTFYKLFRRNRYVGMCIDRIMNYIEDIQVKDPDGCRWDILWEARQKTIRPELLGEKNGYFGVRKEMFDYFMDTGRLAPFEIPLEKTGVKHGTD